MLSNAVLARFLHKAQLTIALCRCKKGVVAGRILRFTQKEHDVEVETIDLGINTNPLAFEELAMSLASLTSFISNGDMDHPIGEFERLYRRALRQPASFLEITELAGESFSTGDYTAGRAAWLLLHTDAVRVLGVHSLLWHNVDGQYFAPLLRQVEIATGKKSQLAAEDHQQLGKKVLPLGVMGLKGEDIWLVQAVSNSRVKDSAITSGAPRTKRLFRGTVFHKTKIDQKVRRTLSNARYVFQKAFPTIQVHTFVLAMHPKQPDFELYHLDDKGLDGKFLPEGQISKNSHDYEDELQEDHESLWTLAERFDNRLFHGVPPCRGGRTLGLLASASTRQLEADELLVWKERGFMEMLKSDFEYDVPRDKVRHDLGDRLVGQGFMRKRGSDYFLTVKGIAR